MANVEGNGKISGFTYSEKALAEKISQYKALTESGEKLLPSWPDFCSFLEVEDATLCEVIERGLEKKEGERSAYYDRAVMLKNMAFWCEAQLVSNPNWGGKMAVKAMFLLKQGLGGTRKYMDEKNQKNNSPMEVKVSFGGDDPRAKKAGK